MFRWKVMPLSSGSIIKILQNTLTTICQLTQHDILKDLNLQQHPYEDLTAHDSHCSYQNYVGHGKLSEL